jgi:hypothetical protein
MLPVIGEAMCWRGAHVVVWLGSLLLALVAGGRWALSRANDFYLANTALPSSTCLECHHLDRCHSFDMDYQLAVGARRHDLRGADEVVARGLFLPNGKVTCHTCHDANSPWACKIVIPPGSKVSRGLPSKESTADDSARAPDREMTVEEAKSVLPAGTFLSPKPLCMTCHVRG